MVNGRERRFNPMWPCIMKTDNEFSDPKMVFGVLT
jgi:hypothetical protein